MRSDDFFTETKVIAADPWSPSSELLLRNDFILALRAAPQPEADDLSAAMGLAMLVDDELTLFGTSGGERLTNEQVAQCLRTLHAVLKRLGVTFETPYRDFNTFRTYWLREGAKGSYQARRDLLQPQFEPLHAELHRLEERAFQATLAEPASPAGATGWPRVDQEVESLRKRFRSATTPQDYRAVGNDAVGVIEALSRTVYDPVKHLQPGEEEPPPDKSKQRIERFIENSAAGPGNAEVRKLARATIELAHKVKHYETPTRRDAGVAADASILLANVLRRLADD